MDILSLVTPILPLIQYPAMLITCSGFLFLTSKHAAKRKLGFVISAIGNFTWIFYGLITMQPAIIGTNTFILCGGAIGYMNNSNKKD